MISKEKRILLRVLFALALVLLIAFIAIDKFYPEPEKISSLTAAEADSIFISVLHDYGLRPEWYVKKGRSYRIKLPLDVPSEVIILDFSEKIKNRNAVLRSKEVIRRTSSVMELFSGKDELLKANFILTDSLMRNNSALSFILINGESLSQEETNELIGSSEKFSMALIPSKANRRLADSLSRTGREYSLLINGGIDELNYRLDDKFSDKKLKLTIQTISQNFPNTVYYLLDNVDETYSPRVYLILTGQLKKMGLNYKRLDQTESVTSDALMKNLPKFLKGGTEHILLIDASEYLKILDELKLLRKRGVRFVNTTAIKEN